MNKPNKSLSFNEVTHTTSLFLFSQIFFNQAKDAKKHNNNKTNYDDEYLLTQEKKKKGNNNKNKRIYWYYVHTDKPHTYNIYVHISSLLFTKVK